MFILNALCFCLECEALICIGHFYFFLCEEFECSDWRSLELRHSESAFENQNTPPPSSTVHLTISGYIDIHFVPYILSRDMGFSFLACEEFTSAFGN